jgi:methylthioribose-1-phosphate isomerase
MKHVASLRWVGGTDGYLCLLDQTRVPNERVEIECRDAPTVVEAIRNLRVRGAPAIGIAAAYGVFLGVQAVVKEPGISTPRLLDHLEEVAATLAATRPTAMNLFWALDRMKHAARRAQNASPSAVAAALLAEAHAIHDDDRRRCEAIGRHGAPLLAGVEGVLTHCNAGALATGGCGTALAVIYAAVEADQRLRVYVDETRPLLQGARLTAWELRQHGVPVTLLCDSMAAIVMRQRLVRAVITGADRIAANGDAANKVGTYGLAVLAQAHGVPFYVAAPLSSFDLATSSGDQIPIEHRDPREVTEVFGRRVAPADIEVLNPAFDVTPAELITAIVCERGVIRPVNAARISAVCQAPG